MKPIEQIGSHAGVFFAMVCLCLQSADAKAEQCILPAVFGDFQEPTKTILRHGSPFPSLQLQADRRLLISRGKGDRVNNIAIITKKQVDPNSVDEKAELMVPGKAVFLTPANATDEVLLERVLQTYPGMSPESGKLILRTIADTPEKKTTIIAEFNEAAGYGKVGPSGLKEIKTVLSMDGNERYFTFSPHGRRDFRARARILDMRTATDDLKPALSVVAEWDNGDGKRVVGNLLWKELESAIPDFSGEAQRYFTTRGALEEQTVDLFRGLPLRRFESPEYHNVMDAIAPNSFDLASDEAVGFRGPGRAVDWYTDLGAKNVAPLLRKGVIYNWVVDEDGLLRIAPQVAQQGPSRIFARLGRVARGHRIYTGGNIEVDADGGFHVYLESYHSYEQVARNSLTLDEAFWEELHFAIAETFRLQTGRTPLVTLKSPEYYRFKPARPGAPGADAPPASTLADWDESGPPMGRKEWKASYGQTYMNFKEEAKAWARYVLQLNGNSSVRPKNKFRELSKKYHPDKVGDRDIDTYKVIVEAYDLLTNPKYF